MRFQIFSIKRGVGGRAELVARAYREATARGIVRPQVRIRRAVSGETCRFGVQAKLVAEIEGQAKAKPWGREVGATEAQASFDDLAEAML